MARRIDPSEVDSEILTAESSVYDYHGLTPEYEHAQIVTSIGVKGVRLTRFSPSVPSDLPPIILLHGVGSISVLAAPLVAHLVDREVLAVDTPGHGLSSRCVLPLGADLRSFGTSLVTGVATHQGWEKVDVVGHSLGGQFGLYAALEAPHRVRRLALLGAPGAAFAGAKPAVGMKVMALPRIGPLVLSIPMDESRFVAVNERFALGEHALAGTPRELAAAGRMIAGRAGNAASIASFFRALIRRGSVRPGVALSAEELHRIHAAVLLAWGDADLFLTPVAAARSIVALRDAHLIRVPGAGHAPWLNAPALVGQALAAHLA